jgi:adenosylcobinamide-GDP ribazoletransferase
MRPWRALVQELRLFLVALQFLTRLPVPGRALAGYESHWLERSVVHFPLVGALVGAIGAAVLGLAGAVWPAWLAALLATAATVWATGAFHEDGLADTFDALGGAVSRERALAIMKDSRIGTYGAAALVLVLGLRVGALATLAQVDLRAAAAALILAHTLGRAAAVVLMAHLPYAGDAEHAKAKPLATAVSGRLAALACIGAALPMVMAASTLAMPTGLQWAASLAVASGVVLTLRHWLRARLGGYTGDTLGACEQLTEAAVLLALCAR